MVVVSLRTVQAGQEWGGNCLFSTQVPTYVALTVLIACCYCRPSHSQRLINKLSQIFQATVLLPNTSDCWGMPKVDVIQTASSPVPAFITCVLRIISGSPTPRYVTCLLRYHKYTRVELLVLFGALMATTRQREKFAKPGL